MWTADWRIKWRKIIAGYIGNICGCELKRKTKNKFRLVRDSNPWPLRYQCSAFPPVSQRSRVRIPLVSRFARSSKNCDFSQFFVLFIITKPDWVAKIAKNRKFDDFSRYLRFLAVLCHVNVHFSRVHDHLKKPFADFTKFANKSKKFSLYLAFWHFPVSAIKAYLHAKAYAASLWIKVRLSKGSSYIRPTLGPKVAKVAQSRVKSPKVALGRL